MNMGPLWIFTYLTICLSSTQASKLVEERDEKESDSKINDDSNEDKPMEEDDLPSASKIESNDLTTDDPTSQISDPKPLGL